MIIEPYAEQHREAILDLSLRAWAPVFMLTRAAVPRFVYESFYPQGWEARQLADMATLLDDEPENVDVAHDGATVTGWVCTRLHPKDRMGELYVLAVDPDHQRRGIGSSLMRHSLARARRRHGNGDGRDRRRSRPCPRPHELRVRRLRTMARCALLQAPRLTPAALSGRLTAAPMPCVVEASAGDTARGGALPLDVGVTQDDPVAVAFPRVALLASPLLGPAVWRPAATALADRGWDVLVVPRLAQAPRCPAQVLAHLLNALPAGRALALVAHSNAGLYLPAVAAGRRVVASVYADAALPAAVGAIPVAPPRMHRFLRDLAGDDGLLPPWTQWWDEEQVAELCPDPACRAAVVAEQHRLPLEYFTATIDAPAGWTQRPAAYLAFGDTYQAERDQAAHWGWPIQTLPGEHLHPLVDPPRVAAALDELLRRQLHAPSA